MKKTLLVTSDFFPAHGGVAAYWRHLAENLPEQDFMVLAPPLPLGCEELAVRYHIHRANFISRFFLLPWLALIPSLLRILWSEKIQHIIVGQIIPVGTVVWLCSRLCKISYSVSAHGMDLAISLKSARKKYLCAKILRDAAHIMVNSSYTASLLAFYDIDPARATIVYPCPSITPKALIAASKKMSAKKIVLTVSRLVQRKGHEDVLDALQAVIKQHPSIEYIIVGEGPYRAELESRARTVGVPVRFLGALSDTEIAAWYDTSDLCIMIPKNIDGDVEGFGIAYLEANSFGKPVIGSRTGGVAEAVRDGETGIVVEPGNIHEIADAISRLLEDQEYAQKLGHQGRERVEKEFRWEVQAEKIKKLVT
jgi:phosphatidyl-myo-inositol dimannoside synthase